MTIRLIKPEEWQQLEPVFREQGGRMSDPKNATAAVAVDDKGRIVAFWTLQRVWHAGPRWTSPEYRHRGLGKRLHGLIERLFEKKPGSGYYSFSDNARCDQFFQELGYRDIGCRVFAKEVK
jgi:hypothetical protein